MYAVLIKFLRILHLLNPIIQRIISLRNNFKTLNIAKLIGKSFHKRLKLKHETICLRNFLYRLYCNLNYSNEYEDYIKQR